MSEDAKAKSAAPDVPRLEEAVGKRVATLFRRLASEFDGEVLNSVAAMKRLFDANKLSFNDLAIVIENHTGPIEKKKYSDEDASQIFNRGINRGRIEEEQKQKAPPEFYDSDGRPRWDQIALFCRSNCDRLRDPKEKEFVNDMAGKMTWRQPTERQGKWLLAIFVKLGGYYEPKVI